MRHSHHSQNQDGHQRGMQYLTSQLARIVLVVCLLSIHTNAATDYSSKNNITVVYKCNGIQSSNEEGQIKNRCMEEKHNVSNNVSTLEVIINQCGDITRALSELDSIFVKFQGFQLQVQQEVKKQENIVKDELMYYTENSSSNNATNQKCDPNKQFYYQKTCKDWMSLPDGSRVPAKEEANINLAEFSTGYQPRDFEDIITPVSLSFKLFPFVQSSMKLIIDIHCASLISVNGVCYGQNNIDVEECFEDNSQVYCQSYWKSIQNYVTLNAAKYNGSNSNLSQGIARFVMLSRQNLINSCWTSKEEEFDYSKQTRILQDDTSTSSEGNGTDKDGTSNDDNSNDNTNDNKDENQNKGDDNTTQNKDENNNTNQKGEDKTPTNNGSSNDKENNTNNSAENPSQTLDDNSEWKQNMIILICILCGVVCCVLFIAWCRHRNNSDVGFASLKANLESDKQRMIQTNGHVMSLGSNSNSIKGVTHVIQQDEEDPQNNSLKSKQTQNVLSNNEKNTMNPSGQQSEQNGNSQKKFSKRASNTKGGINTASASKMEVNNNRVKESAENHSGIQLKLENNGIPLNEQFSDDSRKNTPNYKQVLHLTNQESKGNGNEDVSGRNNLNPKNNNSSNIHSNKVLVSNTSVIEKPEGITNNENLMVVSAVANPAAHSKDKPHETSVRNGLFSIDGEDEEKNHNKIMDSIHLDYESDDTTYSNVFNLEGEEQADKKNSNRKKKKKPKQQQDHLFFDDKNEEQ